MHWLELTLIKYKSVCVCVYEGGGVLEIFIKRLMLKVKGF